MKTRSQGIYYLFVLRPMMGIALALLSWNVYGTDTTIIHIQKELQLFNELHLHHHEVLQDRVNGFLEKDLQTLSNKELRRGMLEILQLKQVEKNYQEDILKIRFAKSIELLRLLYEKLLSIDHHFSSLNTHEHIRSLTNPNDYASFKSLQSELNKKQEKKFNFEFPELLKSNTYLSAAYSLISNLFSGGVSKKSENFKQISCILDFTVSMHSELNIIYFETEFLKDANQVLKKECAELFKECLKPAGYYQSLETCRESDDWEKAMAKIHYFLKEMEDLAAGDKAQIDLQFNIDRVVDFISKYNEFVSQGNKYYGKFEKIISSYQNKDICTQELPVQFNELQSEIKNTIKKFNSAYNLPELKGSKLKELMYGNVY